MSLHWLTEGTCAVSLKHECSHAGTWWCDFLTVMIIFSFWFVLLKLAGHIHSIFFKEFHKSLARIIKILLKDAGPSEAIFFSPKRGDSLDKFLVEAKENGLRVSITELYDVEIWRRHEGFMNGDDSWPSYEKDHCYPLLIRITRWPFGGSYLFNHLQVTEVYRFHTWEIFCLLFTLGGNLRLNENLEQLHISTKLS